MEVESPIRRIQKDGQEAILFIVDQMPIYAWMEFKGLDGELYEASRVTHTEVIVRKKNG